MEGDLLECLDLVKGLTTFLSEVSGAPSLSLSLCACLCVFLHKKVCLVTPMSPCGDECMHAGRHECVVVLCECRHVCMWWFGVYGTGCEF